MAAAVNASIFGVLKDVLKKGYELYGAYFGARGILKGDIVSLNDALKNKKKELLLQTLASILGF